MPKIAVITVSDRVSSGSRNDLSGPLAARLLGHYGDVTSVSVIPDGVGSVGRAIEEAVSSGVDVVFTTGGTGVTARDATPEGTAPLLSQRMEGIEHLLRSNPNVPQAALSRGLAGVVKVESRQAFVLNAPGSQGGVRDAVRIVGPLLGHIVSQMYGGDHPESSSETPSSSSSRSHDAATWQTQNRGQSDGGDASVKTAGVSDEAIVMQDLVDAVDDDSAGALVTFCGQVRNHDNARPVVAIDYEGHPDADQVVARIARAVAAESGACKVAVLHRVGHLKVGDVALGAAVSASHRKEAFRVLEEVVEQVKMQLPIWKCQHFEDGTKEWTGAA